MDVTIRRATPDDLSRVLTVFRDARNAARGLIPRSQYTVGEDEWYVNEVLIRQRETWIATIAGDGVGMMTLHGDWIDQLYVYPTMTRNGVGTQLLDVAKRERPDGLQLWTFRSNAPAQLFYEKHGFVAIEETDGHRNEDRAPDVRYSWRRTETAVPLVTVATAKRVARDLVAARYPTEVLDLVWDQEYAETAGAWAITVDSAKYYMSRLERHHLRPARFVIVPKDGSEASIQDSIPGTVIDAHAVTDPVRLPQIHEKLLYYSQPAAVWKAWLPQLRYFRLEVVQPRDDGRDMFVARIVCEDDVDAAARLEALGVPTRQGEHGLEFAEPRLPYLPTYNSATIDGIDVDVAIRAPGRWRPGHRTHILSFSLREAGDPFRLTAKDFTNALYLEKRFDELGWIGDLDPEHTGIQVVTPDRYPELFS